jgi:hypothetical protein
MTQEQIDEFLGRLEGPEGCDFKEERPGDPNSVTWKCAGGNDKTLSRAILAKMGVLVEDAKAFLELCHTHGGHCDCEILFNAARAVSPQWGEVEDNPPSEESLCQN